MLTMDMREQISTKWHRKKSLSVKNFYANILADAVEIFKWEKFSHTHAHLNSLYSDDEKFCYIRLSVSFSRATFLILH